MIVTYPVHTESYAHALKLAQSMAESHGFKQTRVLGITKTGSGAWEVRMLVS